MSPATYAIWALSILSILGVLLRPRGITEVYWACGGAVLFVLCGLLPVSQAARATAEGTDVYLFLTGMMILSELAREKGVFDWISAWAARYADGSPSRLFLLIYAAGIVVTAFLSNDATAVVLTPAVLATVRRLNVNPEPYLLACAFIANAASFILPISNPANLVVFARHMPPLVRWMDIFFLPSVASVIITYLCLGFLLRKSLREKIGVAVPPDSLSGDGRWALFALGVSALVLTISSALGWPLGLPTCSAALLALLFMTLRDAALPGRVLRGMSWSVIPLVAGLFVIVEALQSTGLAQLAAQALTAAAHLGPVNGNLAAAFSVAFLSNCMNNLPVGLISSSAIQSAEPHGILANAILIGIDLGPNLSVTGSLATILWLMALRRENVKITGWQFLRVGLVIMPFSLGAAILMLQNRF